MFAALMIASQVLATTITSPDGRLTFSLQSREGIPSWKAHYDGIEVVGWSPLGIVTDHGDFTRKVKISNPKKGVFRDKYTIETIKERNIEVEMSSLEAVFTGANGEKLGFEVRVGNNDLAFRYKLMPIADEKSTTVKSEVTGFAIRSDGRKFTTPQSKPMTGWCKTKPSYEERYVFDAEMNVKSEFGEGWTFPALMRLPENPPSAGKQLWCLLGETGTDGNYCACRLSDWHDGMFRINFPMPGEARGEGSVEPVCQVPSALPWRTLTVGDNLAPIVETTVAWDVVKPLVPAPKKPYVFGKGSWSWIIWDDPSMNPADQRKFIDLASAMKWDHILVDGFWDRFSPQEFADLLAYAKAKNVAVYLWYNTNGKWNDAPQTPRDRLNTPQSIEREMQWLAENGIRGIKVDFWGGDKQFVIKRYCALFESANRHGIQVFVHGSTLPRGWERMYPNFVGAEAVLASENLKFNQWSMDHHAQYMSLHPFCRNALATMEFGPVILNKFLRKENRGGTRRVTSENFEIATAVLCQNPVQNFGLCPNNLNEGFDKELDFLSSVPTVWEETRFLAGYPGKFIVLARRAGDKWYVAGVAAEDSTVELDFSFAGGKRETVTIKRNDGFVRVL